MPYPKRVSSSRMDQAPRSMTVHEAFRTYALQELRSGLLQSLVIPIHDRFGKGHQRGGMRHTTRCGGLTVCHPMQVRRGSGKLATRPEQQCVRRSSVEALVECRDPAREQLHLRSIQNTSRAQIHELIGRQILRCGEIPEPPYLLRHQTQGAQYIGVAALHIEIALFSRRAPFSDHGHPCTLRSRARWTAPRRLTGERLRQGLRGQTQPPLLTIRPMELF